MRSILARITSLGFTVMVLASACSQTESTLTQDAESQVDLPTSQTLKPPVVRTTTPEPTQANLSPSPAQPTLDSITPTLCPPDLCSSSGHFLLARPIGSDGRDWVDPTYRYGSTQNGTRDPHHGVEFVNSSGTPVLAAADGEVVVAGTDNQQIYSAWPNFYGNLVIVRHGLPNFFDPIFTLYGHLSEIAVQVGDQVLRGQEIGRVGFTGVATGSHLHFEVRLGENSYDHTRNPELWLAPRRDASGEEFGTIAGRIIDKSGQQLYIPNVVIEFLPGPGQDPLWQLYVETYAEDGFRGDDQWDENFGVGDLPPGWYRISFVTRGMQVREVQVSPGELTFVEVNVDEVPAGG